MATANHPEIHDQNRTPALNSDTSWLIGRNLERRLLIDAFDSIHTKGGIASVFIEGEAGIGKTALVESCRSVFIQQGGRFVTGKATPTTHTQLHVILGEAVEQLARQLLSGDKSAVAFWRKRLQKIVHVDAQILIDLAPSFQFLLGAPPKDFAVVPHLQRRHFSRLLNNLFAAIASSSHPLVLFLDDLQWADRALMEVIRSLLISGPAPPLLLIAAYRADELKDGDALRLLVAECVRNLPNCQSIQLSRLNDDAIAHIIASDLQQSPSAVQSLAQLLGQKTNGNPFYVHALLRKLMRIDKTTEVGSNERTPNLLFLKDAVNALEPSVNALAWLAATLVEQPAEMRRVLLHAACLESSFDANFLASSVKHPVSIVKQILDAACKGNFLKSLDSQHYQFVHDTVQEAAYSLLSKEEKRAIHWHIGQQLYVLAHDGGNAEQRYQIVDHLNRGMVVDQLLEQFNAKETGISGQELVQLNLRAGRQAIANLAPRDALKYTAKGLNTLFTLHPALNAVNGDEVQRCPERMLLFDLRITSAVAAFMAEDHSQADTFLEQALEICNSARERANVYQIQISQYTASHRFSEALAVAHKALAELGYMLPNKTTLLRVISEFFYTRFMLRRQTIEAVEQISDIAELSSHLDQNRYAARSIMSRTQLTAQWMGALNTQALLALRGVRWSLQYGIAPGAALDFALFAVMLIRSNDFSSAFQMSDLALRLAQKHQLHSERSQVIILRALFVDHWRRHSREQLPLLRQAVQGDLDAGEIDGAANVALAFSTCANMAGMNLEVLELELAGHGELIAQTGQSTILHVYQLLRQTYQNMIGNVSNPIELQGEFIVEDEIVPLLAASDNKMGLATYHSLKAMLLVVFGENRAQRQQAVEHADKMKQYFASLEGMVSYGSALYVDTLARLARYSDVTGFARLHLWIAIRSNQRRLRYYASVGNVNHLHRARLIDAEVARLQNRHTEAKKYYAEATAHATDQGFHIEAGGMHEIAARYYWGRGDYALAKEHLSAARRAFTSGGAHAKVAQMEKIYPSIDRDQAIKVVGKTNFGESAHAHQLLAIQQRLANTLSPAQFFDECVLSFQELCLAARVLLLLQTGDDLLPVADFSTHNQDLLWTFPHSIANLVIHTREVLLTDNAWLTSPFDQDSYCASHKTEGVLCLPLLLQGRLLGLLYLEAEKERGIWGEDEVKTLQFLTTPIALLIENALLRNPELLTGLRQTFADRTIDYPERRDNTGSSGEHREFALRIQLLGGFKMQSESSSEITLNRAMSLLLAYLLLRSGEPCRRGDVAEMLWPDSTPQQARTNLRNLLHNLALQWQESKIYIEATRTTLCWLTNSTLWLDMDAFNTAIKSAESALDDDLALNHLRRAIEAYGGDLLPADYEPWVLAAREELRNRYAFALQRVIELLKERSQIEQGLQYAERLRQHDPLQEVAYRHLIQLHALNGDHAQVERVYQQCVAILSQELETTPSKLTTDTYLRYSGK